MLRGPRGEELWGWEWVRSDWVVREGFPEEVIFKEKCGGDGKRHEDFWGESILKVDRSKCKGQRQEHTQQV